MYHLETKIESQGENITLNGTANARFEKFGIGGNSSQETREEFKSTVTGTEITVNDTYINNQTKFNIDGNSYQRENPSPDNPQEITNVGENGIKIKQSGKNKVDFINYAEKVFDSSKVEKLSDGSYKFKHCDTTYTLFEGLLKAPSTLSWYARNDGTGKSVRPTFMFKIFYEDGTIGTPNYETSPDFSLQTIVLTKNVIKIVNSYIGTSPLTIIKDVQLEEGSKATSYEPYHEPIITPINLQGNILSKVGDVKDILKINRNGEVEIKKNTWEEIINGSDFITLSNNNKGLAFYPSKKKTVSLSDNDYLVTNAQRNTSHNDGTVYQNPVNFVFVGSPTDTLKTIKAKFNGGKILYQLATPQIITLPSISPIELWQGTNIFSLVTNLDTEIELEYNYIPQSPSPEAPSEIKNVKDNINIKIADKNNEEQQEILFPLVQGQKLMQGDYLADDGIHHTKTQIQLDGVTNGLKVLNVTKHSNDIYYCVINLVKQSLNNTTDVSSMYCSHFMPHFEVKPGSCYIAGSGLFLVLVLTDQTITTVDAANTWLAAQKEKGTPVVIEYKLAEEEIETYTEVQKEAWKQIKNARSYEGQTNIFSTDEISPMFDVSAYKGISEEFKQRLLNGKITRAYLKVLATDTKPEMIIDENNYLKDCTFEELRYVPDEGFIGGTVAKRVTGNFNNVNSSFSIQDREFELYLGVDLEDGTTEYIKYGTFIVQKPEDDQVTDNTSFEALDYMIKLNLPWVDRMTYPCTLKELFDDLVAQSGLSTKVTSFLNQNFIVENNQFEEGTTRREVLKAIAQIAFNWARIDEDNDIVMDFEKKDEVAETLTADNYYNLKKQDKYGPINVIVLRNSQVEGENVTLKDEYSINYPIGKNYCPDIEKWELTNGAYIKDGYIVLPNSNSQAKIIFIKPEDVDNELYLNYISNSDESNYGTHINIDYLDENKKIINSNGNAHINLNGENNIKANFGGNNEYGNAIKEAKYIRIIFIRGSTYTPLPYKIKNVMLNKSDINYEPFIPNGETELVISDNPFAYTQSKRAKLIEAGRILFGLTYVPMSMDMIGYMYLNCKDKIKATNLNNETFETYLLNHTIEYTGTISDSMEAPAVTKTETKYQFTPQMIEALKHTELLIDKANQRITEVVEKQTDFSNELTKQETSLSGISQQVSKIYDFKKSVKGIYEIVLEDALPTNILKFEAIAKNVVGIYPKKTLYPSPKLYPKKGGATLTLVFGRTSRGSIPNPILPKKTLYPSSILYPRADGSYIREYSFYIGNPLREYLGKHDIFRVENDTEKGITVVKVIRYVKYENGQYGLYDEPIEEIIDDTQQLQLFKGNNFVYIKEFTDWDISADYIFNNELNKQYAPRVETNANIKTLNNEIELKVSEKVGKDEVITAINLTPEKAKIKSKNLELEGITTINGGFSIDEKGNASIANDTVKINEKGIQLADGASLVGGEGLITNLQFYGKVTHVYGAMNTEGYYDALGFEVDELTAGACVATSCTISADLPKNFTVVSAYVTIKHYPTKFYFNNNHGWGYSRKLKLYQRSSSSMYREYNIFGGALIPSNYGIEVPNAFGKESFTPSIPNDTSQKVDIVTSIDLTEYLSSETNYQSDFIIRSSDTPPAYTGDQSTGVDYVNCGYKTGMVMAVLNVYGYLRLENKEE